MGGGGAGGDNMGGGGGGAETPYHGFDRINQNMLTQAHYSSHSSCLIV